MASLLIPPPEDPVRAAAQWLGEAEALGRRNANAMALASVDARGRPSARMVLLKELAPLGYAVFYTNYGSRKGGELLSTRRAAAVLYWHELGRQVRFEGPVVRSPEAESDAYFATRPLREPSQRLEQRAEPPAAGSRRARGARRQGRRHQARRPRPASARFLGRIPLVARSRSSSGSKAATASTNACATSAGSTRATRTLSRRAAGARSACNPSDATA